MDAFNFLCTIGLLAALQVAVTHSVSYSEKNEIVNKHNELRRIVQPSASNMLEMSWNAQAAANAQRWANRCTQNHSPDNDREISSSGCGENLYMSSNRRSWSEAIQSWYDEVKDFQYGVGSINGGMVGHYTQVVWWRSNFIGCAMAYCPNMKYKYYYVCQYCPPGNFGGMAYPYKSGPSCGDCRDDCDNKLCTNPCPYVDKYSNCDYQVKKYGCSNRDVVNGCPESCKCNPDIPQCDYYNQYSNCDDLKRQWGCSNPDVADWCPASCKC